jgi:hypothetical protein
MKEMSTSRERKHHIGKDFHVKFINPLDGRDSFGTAVVLRTLGVCLVPFASNRTIFGPNRMV